MKHAFPSPTRLLACCALLLGLIVAGCGTPSTPPAPVREMPDADRSTVTVSKAMGVRANGKDSVSIQVTVLTASGSPLSGRTVKVVVPDGDVTQPTGPTNDQGVVTATLTSTLVGTKTVTASVDADGGPVTLSQRPTVEFVLLPAAKLAFTAAPTSGTAGDPLGAFEVTIQDADGQTVVGAHDTVTVKLGEGPVATLLGKVSATAVNGVARLSGLRIEKAAKGYTLVASASGLTDATSAAFEVVAAAPASFSLSHPTTALQAGVAREVDLSVFDSYANLASGYTGTVHFSSDDDAAVLPADYTFTAADAGHHTFSPGVVLTRAGSRRVTVKDTALASLVDTVEFPVSPGLPARLYFAQQPGDHSVRASFGVQVGLTDAYGNTASSGSAAVKLTLSKGGTLDGTTSVTAVDGLALFTGLSVEEENTGYVLTASGSSLTSTTSAAFTITDDVPPAAPMLSLADATASSVKIAWTAVGDDGLLGRATRYDLRYSTKNIVTEADFTAATPVTPLAAPGLPGSAESATIPGLEQGSSYYVALKVTDSAGNATRSATLLVSTPYPTATQLVFTQQPQNGTAGLPLAPIQVEIRDASGLLVSNATTAVTLTVQGVTGFGPFTVAADKGVATFTTVRIDQAGLGYTLRATAAPLTPATSTPFDITSANASRLELTGLPSSVTAGTSQGVTVTVRDAFGNVAEGFTGTVSFSSSDTAAALPTNYTFTSADKGQHAFTGVVLRTSGAQTLSVAAAGLTGATASVTVTDAPPSKLVLAGLPGSVVAGASTTFTVERRDGFDARDTGYTGTVHFSSTDTQAEVPADYTFTAADLGIHTFTVKLKTAGTWSLKVQDTASASISDTASTSVKWAPVASLVFTAPGSVVAGNTLTASVTAQDAYGNTVKDYTGTVSFTASPSGATVPSDYTFVGSDEGVRQFNFTLPRSGTTTLTVADAAAGLSATATVTVTSAAVSKLVLTAPTGTVVAGTTFSVDVTAQDAFGNTASGYTGTVHVSASDAMATLPADITFAPGDAGHTSFSVTFKTAGSQTLTVQDTATPSLSALASISVTWAPLASLMFSAPASVASGVAFTGTVSARDAYGNVVKDYTGTVSFTASSTGATVPIDYTFSATDEGVRQFGFTLSQSGGTTLTVKDTAAGLSATATVMVTSAPVAKLVLAAPTGPLVAGTVFSVDVTAQDAFGNVISDYAGTVHFSSSDSMATLPADAAFTSGDAGHKSFSVTLKTAGTQTLTVQDTATPSLSASASISVTWAPVAALVFTAPASATSGAAFTGTVSARDGYGNVVKDYMGTVSFTASSTGATVPTDYTFSAGDQGVRQFSFTLSQSGSTILTVKDTAAGLSATATVMVTSAPVAKLVFMAPTGPLVAGTVFSVDVTAQDAFGNVISDYAGTVHFTSSDAQAVLPADAAFTSGDAGHKSFSVTLKTAGSQTLTVQDTATPSLSASANISVTWAPLASLMFSAPASAASGTAFTGTVSARDAYGNVVKDYTGTVSFTASSTGATVPTDYTFSATDEGVRQFSFTLSQSGSTILTVKDTAASLSATATVTVTAAAAVKLVFTAPTGPLVAGTAFSVDVMAQDTFGNVATGYTGTVHFSSSDAVAALPADATFVPGDAGHKSFSVTLKTAGSQTLTVQDTVMSSLSATATLTVTAGPVTALVLEAPASGVAGSTLNGAVTARDAYGNTVTGYTGTVSFSADTTGATLPVDYTFTASDNGRHPFTFTLQKAGPNTLKVKDTAASLSASATVTISASTVSALVALAPAGPFTAGTAVSVDVTLQDAYGNVTPGYTGTVHFSSSDPVAVLPPDATFTPGDAGHKSFSVTLKTAGSQTVTVTDAAQSSLTSMLTRQVNPGSPAKLAFRAQPSNRSVRSPLPNVTVAITDAYGNTVAASSPSITVGLVGGNPAATLAGTLTVAPVSGVATFSGLSVDQQGTSFHLEAVGAPLDGASSQTFNIVDDVAPATAMLTLSHQTSIQVQVDWVAVGDDGTLGTATSHELRYATSAITPATFASATAVSLGAPQPSGSAESVIVTGLTPSTPYYFALRVTDDSGNTSFATASTSTNADPCAGYTCTPAAPSCAVDGVSRATYTASCVDVSNTPTCQQTETVTACTGTNAVCFKGACDTAAKPAANQIVLSEIMHTPTGGTTEYFELTNTTNNLLNLNGLTVSYQNAAGTETTFVVGLGSVPVVMDRKGAFVMAANKTLASNGGVPVDYQYPSSVVLDGSGQFNFFNGETLLESLGYTTAFPQTAGKAMVLSSRILGSSANVFSWYWCDSPAQLPGGNYGSPGAANTDCGITSSPTIDMCKIQTPATYTATTGTATSITSRVHGASVTDRNLKGNDFYPYLRAEIGYGSGTGSAAAWTWTPILSNGAYAPTSSSDDETRGSLTFSMVGTYRYGFRYYFQDPVTGKGTYTYCGQTGIVSDPATLTDFGTATINPTPPTTNHVVISEFAVAGSGGAGDEFVEIYNPTSVDVSLSGWKIQYKSSTGTSYSTAATLPTTAKVVAHGYYLVASKSYSGSGATAADYLLGTDMSFSGTVGHVRLGNGSVGSSKTDSNAVDWVGYGTGADSAEGNNPATGTITTTSSFERKAYSSSTASSMVSPGSDYNKGNGYDSDNNGYDFLLRANRDPQNSLSALEIP